MKFTKKSNEDELSPRNKELRDSLDLKDGYSDKRHTEKKDLVFLRQRFALELLNLRDKIAGKRHKERITVLNKRLN